MENQKNYKPKSCRQCPVGKLDSKKKLKCGCQTKVSASTPFEENYMWKNCPIAWDKEKK